MLELTGGFRRELTDAEIDHIHRETSAISAKSNPSSVPW
jgi:hypothetical protein